MEAPEEDAEFLTLASPTQGVTLRVTPQPYSFAEGKNRPGNQLSWSNNFGYSIIANPTTEVAGFSLYTLANLRQSLKSAEPHSPPSLTPSIQVQTDQTVDHVKFAMGDKIVLAGMRDGSVGVWRLKFLVEGNLSPLRTIPSSSPSPILSILPNPSPSSPLICILSTSPSSPPVIHNLETSSLHSTFPSDLHATSSSWSVKGKQLVFGTSSGQIVQYTPEAELKASLPLPSSLMEQGGEWEVKSLDWLENHVFLVTYGRPLKEGEQVVHEDEVLVVTRDPKSGGIKEEVRFLDPCPAFGMMDLKGNRFIRNLKNWSPFKQLLFVSSTPSSDVGLLSQSLSTSSWSSLVLSDTSRPTLPQSSSGEEVAPLGMELDLNVEEGISVWCLTSEGVLVCWKVGNEKSEGAYEGLIKTRDVLTQEQEEGEESASTPTPAAAPSPKPPAQASTPSAFASFSTPATSEAAKPNPTGFGQSGFGSFSTSSSSTPAFATPSIASPSSTKPTFGQSSGFGSFAASSSSSTPTTTPSVTTGGFGSTSNTTAGGGFSAFGSGTSSSGFGALASKPTTGGGSVFGSGGNAFGSSSTTPSAFGSSSTTPSAFGGSKSSTTTKSVFGSSSSTPTFGSSSPAPAPSFSFASNSTQVSTRPRGGMDSDDEEEEDKGMGQDDGGRVDEPPDLEPTKSGLDIGESMREAAKAGGPKRSEQGGSGGTVGFGGLGVGTQAKPQEEEKKTTSVFGSTTPAFGATASAFGAGSSPAFGSSIKPATGFSFGQSPAQTPKPSTPTTPQPEVSKMEELKAPASTGFSFGSSPSSTSGFPKPATTGGFGGFSSGTGGFGSSTSSSTGGFGSFASTKNEDEKPKSSFGAFGSVSSPSSGGFAGFGTVKKEEEKNGDKVIQEKKDEVKKEEPVPAKSPFSFAATPTSTPTTTSTTTSSTAPSPAPTTSAFGSSGTASTGFPKPASTGGFGSFSSPSTGGGFGSFSSSPASGGFGSFASPSSSTAPKPATGFSFAASSPKPSSPSPAPAFSFAAAPKKEEEEPSSSAPKKIEEKKDENGKPVSTKSLFGFASSPTEEKEVDSSLMSRLSAEKGTEDEGGEDELGSEGEQGENYDENEDGEVDEEEEPYDEEQDYDEEERQYSEHEEGEPEIKVKDEETEETIPPASVPAASPSLLSRLSPAPTAVEPPSPAASPSPPPVESKPVESAPVESKPPTFSFGTPTTPASPTPSPPLTATSTTPTQAPAAEKSPFSFAPSPSTTTTSSKPSSFLGFTSSAPRSSSPLSAPPLAAPPAFSSAPKISSPLSFAPPSGSSNESKKDEKSPFGGFSGFGSSASTSSTAPGKLAPSPGFSFGAPPAPTTPPAQSPAPQTPAGGFSFGSTAAPSAPSTSQPVPDSKPSSSGFSFGAKPSLAPPVEAPKPVKPEPTPPPTQVDSKPAPPKERVGVSLANAQAPKVGPELVRGAAPNVQEKGMAGEFLKAYLSVQRDFEILRTNSSVIKNFAKEIAVPLQRNELKEGERVEYDDRKWSMGDLDKLKQLTKQLRPSVEALHGEAVKQKRKTAELQSQMLKGETKREEAARFVRAKNDPAFAKMVRIRQLGPEQIENQRKIRAQMEAVRSRLEQLEDHLLALKTKVTEDQKGRSSFKAPSLDSVNRAVRNITVAVTEKTVELDELTQRLDQVRLGLSDGTPQRRQMRHRSPSVALEETLNQSSVLRQSSASNGIVAGKSTPSAGSIALAKAALDAEKAAQMLKQKLLDQRANKPLKINRSASAIVQNTKATVAADLQLTFAKGPITADRLPRPRRQSPPPSPQALSPIPLLPAFKASPAPIRSSYTPPVETPKPSTSTPVATPKFAQQPAPSPLSFSTAPPSFSLPTTSAPPPLSLGGGLPFSAAPPPPMNFGGAPSTSAPPPLFPSLTLKAAPQISFAATPPVSTPPATSGTRGSAARTSKDRNHSSAAQLKPSSGTPPAAASSFDWGPLPSSLSGTTPSKPAASPFSFGGSSTPSQGISPSGFVSLGSPFALTTKPAATPGGGFSFGAPPATSTTPSKPPAKFSFGAPAEEEESSSDDDDEEVEGGGGAGEENEEGDYEGEYQGEEDEEEWDGEEGYSEEEGLDTIGEEEEEYDE